MKKVLKRIMHSLIKNGMGNYVIVKMIKQNNNKVVPVILLDSTSTVMEFDTLEDAEKIKNTFQINSDSDYKYEFKKICLKQ